ncbi:MAG: glycosyltransferase family 10 [Gallionella sp.]|nr:glycosyltransferase family 10 [Gallionella sp.]
MYRIAAESGISVVSGDIAIANVASNKWNAKDVYVIQDMRSTAASKLLDFGANPFLITCLEAPLYAPFFYDNISRIAGKFRFSLGFGFPETRAKAAASGKNLQFRFPSYYLEDMREIRSWENRKKLVLVAANKYKSGKTYIPDRLSLTGVLRQLKSASWQLVSPAYRKSLAASLLDRRLEAVEYFAGNKDLDLYGSGWGDLSELPSTWANRLYDVINDQYLGRCSNKLETISGYRFSICFENTAFAGYVTEKIVDCFVAGTVPLYLGAPDIETIVPAESFIDMRKFGSFEQLDAYINSMNEDEAIKMVEAGRHYLQTEIGMLHSYEGFARNTIRLAKTC